jgi:citrate lyase beta subunit
MGIRLGGGGLNPAVVAGHTVGLTPTAEEISDAHWVIEQYRQLTSTGDAWREVNGRVIDRYEAAHARATLEYAALCAARDKEKAEAAARVKAAQDAEK